jgi:hypothetical protein
MKQSMEKRTQNIKDKIMAKNFSQQVLSKKTIENYGEINMKCEKNLQKVTEVKLERKRASFKSHDKRKKFQVITKGN